MVLMQLADKVKVRAEGTVTPEKGSSKSLKIDVSMELYEYTRAQNVRVCMK